ncbi:MAG: DNA mismatch repair protein MutH [Myxococcales bacterium]|nr:DNA mismatch repair protein MutH [Myxococcales bacterium]
MGVITPPTSEEELLARARALAGRTVGEVARALGERPSHDPRRTKGLAGQLAERALGADAGSLDEPDFLGLGVELKTLPVSADGRPQESTYVCVLSLGDLAERDFEDTAVWRKLARVLWVPIEAKSSDRPLLDRRYGTAFLWSPTPSEVEVLRADYERVAVLVSEGHVDQVTGHLGEALQVRPKAAHGRQRTLAPDAEGGWQWTGPRGFYLRPSFTGAILEAAFRE